MNESINEAINKEINRVVGRRTANESYVVSPKKFELKTELLGGRTKRSRQEEFETGTKVVNEVSAELDTANRQDANEYHLHFRNLKRDESYNVTLSALRAAHFKNISSLSSVITADSITFMRLERDFGSFDDWQRDFIACAAACRSGFVVTAYSFTLRRYLNYVVDNDLSGLPFDSAHVIVLDMAQGAYYRDYANDKKTYVGAMMKEFDWEEIELLFKRVERLARMYDAKT